MTELEARLIAFAGEQLLVGGADLGPTTELLLSGLVDSLGVVQVVGWIEDESGVAVDPGDVVLENFETIGAIASFAERLRTVE